MNLKEEKQPTKPDEKSNYEMYYDYSELVCRIPSHRILAINREWEFWRSFIWIS